MTTNSSRRSRDSSFGNFWFRKPTGSKLSSIIEIVIALDDIAPPPPPPTFLVLTSPKLRGGDDDDDDDDDDNINTIVVALTGFTKIL